MFLLTNGLFFGLLGMLSWGVADYFAAVTSRKIGSFSTFFWSQIISLFIYISIFFFIPLSITISSTSVYITIATAFLMILAYASFYKSLEVGKVAIGTSISACWGLVTAMIAVLFLGESLGLVQFLGIGCAIVGIILTSMKKKDLYAIKLGAIHSEKGTKLGFIALVGWGVAFALIDTLVSSTDWFHAILLVKVVTAALLFIWVFAKKIPIPYKTMLPTLFIVGLLETLAYLAFGFGITIGQTAIVAPVISTYPVAAIILARLFLKEKLEIHQYAGIGVVLLGVALLAI